MGQSTGIVDIIKSGLEGIGCDVVDQIQLTEQSVHWYGFVTQVSI